MLDLLKYLSNEGRVVLRAPLAFIFALALVAIATWAVANWSFQSRIEDLNSRWLFETMKSPGTNQI